MPLKIGVIGTGMIGTEHVGRLAQEVAGSAVTAVFDVAAERAARVAAGVGARSHPSAFDLICDDDVDAVVIASPGDLHAEQAIACIAAGKPVLCEKPLATGTADALKVVEAEAAAGRRFLQVGFMRRFDHAYLELKTAMTDGTIGEPLMAHAVHRTSAVPAGFTGEMSLTDSVVHEFDLFRWLFDREIVSVEVLAPRRSPLAPAHLRDPQLVILELAGGVLVDVESFVNCQYGYDVRCEIVGSLGTAAVQNPGFTAISVQGRRSEAVPADWRVRFGQAYTNELQAWVRGCREGVVGGPSAWDGFAAVAVAASAVSSYAGGQRVRVSLPDKPALYA
ncbi:Gfo/Idh/MocA family protein [Spirillospora sp. CA-142024]|uniref:Gfo/Idh/MocA family protein n=1 Tax=Spirillospora sp. CA-142024 TaxID=3240036 RepID=UPI003D916AF2